MTFDPTNEEDFELLKYAEYYRETLVAMLLAINSSNLTVEALRQVELLKWKIAREKLRQAKREFNCDAPTLDEIEKNVVQRQNFIYALSLDSFSLLWIKRTKNGKFTISKNAALLSLSSGLSLVNKKWIILLLPKKYFFCRQNNFFYINTLFTENWYS